MMQLVSSLLLCFIGYHLCKGTDIYSSCNHVSIQNCTTISSFADYFEGQVNSEVILSFGPGIHLLNTNLSILNVSKFVMFPTQPEHGANIVCDNAIIGIFLTANVNISNVNFSCKIVIREVNKFALEEINISSFNSTVQYLAIFKAAVTVIEASLSVPVYISESNITVKNSTIHHVIPDSSGTTQINDLLSINTGGVLTAIGSIVELSNSTFLENSPYEAGVLHIKDSVVSSLEALIFTKNNGDMIRANNSTLQINGNMDSTKNWGIISLERSNFTLIGEFNMTDNYPVLSSSHGMVSAFYQSKLIFSGKLLISNNNCSGIYSDSSEVHIIGNATLSSNFANVGGGIYALESEILFNGVILIRNNSAASKGGGLYVFSSQVTFHGPSTMIELNQAQKNGGGISAFLTHLNFYGQLRLEKNSAGENGGGIFASTTLVKFYQEGKSTIQLNSAMNGGGLYLQSNSKLLLLKDREDVKEFRILVEVNFKRNAASSKGGAIFVNDETYLTTCEGTRDSRSSQECFIQTYAYYPIGIYQRYNNSVLVNIVFSDNFASEGDTLYGGLLDRCISSDFSEVGELPGIEYINEITNITNKTNNAIASEPLTVVNCTAQSVTLNRGQTATLSVVIRDQSANNVPAVLLSTVNSNKSRLSEGQAIQDIKENCTTVQYNIFSSLKSEKISIYPDGPCRDRGNSLNFFHVKFKPCPAGFQLSGTNVSCECHPAIKPYTQDCDIDTETIRRHDEFWVSYTSILNVSGVIIHPHCPYDYCYPPTKQVFVNLNSKEGSDSQCAFNRSGTLCGACKEGLSLVLGSSKCKICTNKTIALILPIAMAGIILVVLIMALDLTVDKGLINGLFLYVNIVIAAGPSYLPSDNMNYATTIISWINLDVGFEVCFYNGMDTYSRTWLELPFPLYMISLVGMIIFISERSDRFVRLLGRSNPVAVLATLILISYARLIRVIITVLSFTTITYPDGHVETVWLADASVHYLQGKHIPLFATAIFIMISGTLYTAFLTFRHLLFSCNQKPCMKWLDNTRLTSFVDAYHAPFNPKYRSWSGVLLILRVATFLSLALNPRGDKLINLIIIAILVFMVLITKQALGNIYKTQFVNVLEDLYLLNLGIFSVASISAKQNGFNQAIIAYISINAALIMFVIAIFYHFLFVKNRKLISKLLKKKAEITVSKEISNSVSKSCKSDKTATILSGEQEPRLAIFTELREELLDF